MKNTRTTHICEFCGKEYKVPRCRSGKTHFCSISCRAKQKGSEFAKFDSKCMECGKELKLKKSRVGKTKFCGRACYAKWQSRTLKGSGSPLWRRKEVACKYCGKKFIAKGDRIAKGQGIFCSLKCWSIWQRVHMPKKRTNIEKLMASALDSAGIKYEQEVPIKRIAVVDFLIKDKNLIVQCDGDYWHSLPHMILKDNRQDSELTSLGYTVKRYLGSRIMKDSHDCAKEIQELCLSLR